MPLVQKLFARNFKFCFYWDWGFNFYNFEKICLDTKKEMPASEILKLKPEIEGIKVFDYNYLYSAYADDTTFFLEDIISIKHMFDTFYLFRYFLD